MPRGYYRIPEVVQIANRFRRQLDERDDAITWAMANKWLLLSSDLDDYVERISREISRLSGPVTEAWLNELNYYKQLQEQAHNATSQYVSWAESYTNKQMMQAVKVSSSQASYWLEMQGGQALGYFGGLPQPQIEAIYALVHEKSPLKELFNSITQESWSGENPIGKTLIEGFSVGMPAKKVGELIHETVLDVPLKRAMLIARTEINRAHRTATLQTYRKYGVVKKYKRMASRKNACMACLLLDGTVYSTEQEMGDHPNGACTMIPIVDGMPEPEWKYGKDYFMELSEEEQRKRMGNNYYDAWKRGDFKLEDMVKVHHSNTWGDSPGIENLSTLSPDWRKYAKTSPRKAPVNIPSYSSQYERITPHNGWTDKEIRDYVSSKEFQDRKKYWETQKDRCGNPELKAIEEKLGINGLPPGVDAKTFEQMVKNGEFDKVVYRGLDPTWDRSVEEMVKQYQKSKDMYIGRGIYGDGTYTNPDPKEAGAYGAKGMRLGIDKRAKKVEFYTVYEEFKEFMANDENRLAWLKCGVKDINTGASMFAMLRGYDVVYITGIEHHLILNRTMTWVVNNEVWDFLHP